MLEGKKDAWNGYYLNGSYAAVFVVVRLAKERNAFFSGFFVVCMCGNELLRGL